MEPGEKQDTFFALVNEVEKLGNAMGVKFEGRLEDSSRKILMGSIAINGYKRRLNAALNKLILKTIVIVTAHLSIRTDSYLYTG